MKNTVRVLSAVAVAAMLLVPSFAGEVEAKKEVKLEGYITDQWCGAANANAKGAACAKACAEKGSKLGIYANGKLYLLSDKKKAMKNLGLKVIVTGVLADDGSVEVSDIQPAPEKDA